MVFILPLIPKSDLILTVQILFLIVIYSVLFATQPPLTLDESKENKNRDKSSIWLIMAAVVLICLATTLEWAYVQSNFISFKIDGFTITGLILIIGGSIFRIMSIRTLGKFFTAAVRTQEKQEIIQHGVYKYLRHPSYLGAYLAIIGTPVFMHAYYSIVFAAIAMFIAYWFRIKVEEIALVEDFGKQYTAYQAKTKRMFPLIY